MLGVRGVAVAGRLGEVTATLVPGTITAICGPNGAGKSTLLAVLAGLLDTDGGDVLLGDRPLAALSVTGPVHRFRPEPHADAVRAAAAGVAATLGRRPRP